MTRTLFLSGTEHIRPVAAQYLGLGLRRQPPRLIEIPQEKLPRLERSFLGIAPSKTAPLDRRLADAVPKAEWFAPCGKLIAVLPVDLRHARHLLVGLSC